MLQCLGSTTATRALTPELLATLENTIAEETTQILPCLCHLEAVAPQNRGIHVLGSSHEWSRLEATFLNSFSCSTLLKVKKMLNTTSNQQENGVPALIRVYVSEKIY